MADKYDHTKVEKKWQEKWLKDKVFSPQVSRVKNPYYNLMMFPYPSAEGLHVGNMYAFTGADVYGRFNRMQGKDVFEPIGLDGFGIHSENYAIKIGRHPKEHAKISEKHYYDQLHMIGNSFDWDRTLETYDPKYYRWTQWLFIQMFKKGLAYKDRAMVNWCPSDKTVLSDEQVIDGKCERCGSEVTKRGMSSWFFKITKYADKLLENIEKIDWPEKIKIAQRNWIGKSEGILFKEKVKDLDIEIEVFDTVPQTFIAQTFAVIAPEHPLVEKLVKGTKYEKEVMTFVDKIKKKKITDNFDIEKETEGIFTGRYVENPFGKGDLPIWIASYAIYGYGTGIVNCSAHDERDFAFAKKYGIPLKVAMLPKDSKLAEQVKNLEFCYHHAEDGIIQEPQEFKGMTWLAARKPVIDYIEKKGLGEKKVNYHLRDWGISRQRYWGPPIPMIYCKNCADVQGTTLHMSGWSPVPEEDLPVLLPDIQNFKPEGDGTSPLHNAPESWKKVKCPKCGKDAERELDVSDTFLDSSWYFLRYPSLGAETEDKLPFDPEITKKWLPVNAYIGGAEHAVLHLMYARFVTMVLKDLGFVDFEEPFPFLFGHGLIIKDGAKMSKSKGNVVNPDEYIAKFGADALRTYLMFLGPFDQGGDFRDTGIEGMGRFLNRVWKLFTLEAKTQKSEVQIKLNQTIKKVTEDVGNFKYNTAIASIMELVNAIYDQGADTETLKNLCLLLAPFAPHMMEEIWVEYLHMPFSIHKASWPLYEAKYINKSEATIIVQINGKLRSQFTSNNLQLTKEEAAEIAKKDEKIAKYIDGVKIKNIIFVSGKLLNFVTE